MNRLSYYTKFIFQMLSIAVLKLFVFRPRLTSPEPLHIEAKERYIVASNHRHAIDPFYVSCSFRWRDLIHLLPFAIMTANKFYDPWWIRIPAWLGGCFPAHGPKPIHGVVGALKLLRRGHTVLIFPEGKRIRSGKGEAKSGVSQILNACPSANLLIAHIEWKKPPRHASIGYTHKIHDLDNPNAILNSIYEIPT